MISMRLFLTENNKSNPTFVLNFLHLAIAVPKKSLTEI